MERLYSFTLCESVCPPAPNSETKVNTLVSPILAIRPQYIPGLYSFGVAIGVAGVDLKKENTARFAIISPIGKEIQNSPENLLPIIDKDDCMPPEYQGFVLTIDFRNVEFDVEGEYQFVLYLNGKELGKCPMPVYKRVE